MAEEQVSSIGANVASKQTSNSEERVSSIGANVASKQTSNSEERVSSIGANIGYITSRVYADGTTFGKDGERDAVPSWGDRAAWRVNDYPELHADDLSNAVYHAHMPPPASAGRIAIDQGAAWLNLSITGDAVLAADGALNVTTIGGISAVLVNGANPLTADWDAGAFKITAQGLTAANVNATTALQLAGTSINTAGTLSNVAYLNQANVFSANQRINGSLGIGNSPATYPFEVWDSTDADYFGINLDGLNVYFYWNDGNVIFETKEINANGIVQVRGNGTGYGQVRVYNSGNTAYAVFSQQGLAAFVNNNYGNLHLQNTAEGHVVMFFGAVSGETKELVIYGYNVGAGAKEQMQIGVGVDAVDTASFDGLSNYWFDGTINAQTAMQIAGASINTAGTLSNVAYLNQANSFTLINPLTTIAESWIGPSSTTGVYFKGGYVGLGTITPSYPLTVAGATNQFGIEIAGVNRFLLNVGVSVIDFSPLPDGAVESSLRFFRSTNTTGAVKVIFLKGNNTTTISNQISCTAGTSTIFNNNSEDIDTVFRGDTDANLLRIDAGADNVGVGVGDPDTKFEVYKVGTQLKLSGGPADFMTVAVAANGATTLTTVDSTGALANIILAPDGNVSVGAIVPTYKFSVGSTDNSDQVGIYHDNADAYFTTDDGEFRFLTDEGVNTNSVLAVTGKGTGYGVVKAYDNDMAEAVQFYCLNGAGYLQVVGIAPGRLHLNAPAANDITMFVSAASGETEELFIHGFRAGDINRSLQIGVGVDAADTASFDGVSNYWFDGTINAQTAMQIAGASINTAGTLSNVAYLDQANVFSANQIINGQVALGPTITTPTAHLEINTGPTDTDRAFLAQSGGRWSNVFTIDTYNNRVWLYAASATRRFEVTDNTNPQIRLNQSPTYYAEFQADSVGALTITTSAGNIYAKPYSGLFYVQSVTAADPVRLYVQAETTGADQNASAIIYLIDGASQNVMLGVGYGIAYLKTDVASIRMFESQDVDVHWWRAPASGISPQMSWYGNHGGTEDTLLLKVNDGEVETAKFYGVDFFKFMSADHTNYLKIYHDNANAHITTDDGAFRFKNLEGVSESTIVEIRGSSYGGDGHLRIYNGAETEYLQISQIAGGVYITTNGTSPAAINLNHTANGAVRCFYSSVSGDTQPFSIAGYRSGDTVKRTFTTQISSTVNNRVEFSGLELYHWTGRGMFTDELKIKIYSQDAEPSLSEDGYFAIWKDTNDSNRIYILFRRAFNEYVKVELT